jgi:hypothetical protein
MPRYRNDGSMPLNYSDSGGPEVAPGAEFEHTIPPAQLASHLGSGFISVVVSDVAPATIESRRLVVDEVHVHVDRTVVDALTKKK